MINLNGNEQCDRFIKVELERARIPVEHALAHRNMVPYTLVGRLGEIAFSRAWTYWVARGLVPIETAEELYNDPVGRTDVRVAGHAAAPPPLEWSDWITADGRIVYPAYREAAHVAFLERNPDVTPSNDLFSDDPEELGAKRFVTTYHIDTEVGLRVFSDILRARSLVTESA